MSVKISYMDYFHRFCAERLNNFKSLTFQWEVFSFDVLPSCDL